MRSCLKNCFLVLLLFILPGRLPAFGAPTTGFAREALTKALLGKNVKALLDVPGYKDGVDLFMYPTGDKPLDERGIDLKDLDKFLRETGVGVERDEWVKITDVKIDIDQIDIYLGGSGESRGAGNDDAKSGPHFKAAVRSRLNFRYGRVLTDGDITLDAFLPLLGRVLDTSKIHSSVAPANASPEFESAIRARDIIAGMTYKMVLTSAGEPEQKKLEDSTDDSHRETWFYFRDGHRWIVKFLNGKVAKVQIF